MRAHNPERFSGKMAWLATTHSLAAAHAELPVVRWLVAQEAPSPKYTTLHHNCDGARMLLLAHGHGWKVPQSMLRIFRAAERRRTALYSVVRRQRRQHAEKTRLGDLPDELFKRIACQADIDFSWRYSPQGAPLSPSMTRMAVIMSLSGLPQKLWRGCCCNNCTLLNVKDSGIQNDVCIHTGCTALNYGMLSGRAKVLSYGFLACNHIPQTGKPE